MIWSCLVSQVALATADLAISQSSSLSSYSDAGPSRGATDTPSSILDSSDESSRESFQVAWCAFPQCQHENRVSLQQEWTERTEWQSRVLSKPCVPQDCVAREAQTGSQPLFQTVGFLSFQEDPVGLQWKNLCTWTNGRYWLKWRMDVYTSCRWFKRPMKWNYLYRIGVDIYY